MDQLDKCTHIHAVYVCLCPHTVVTKNAKHHCHTITALAQSKFHLIKIGSVQFCSTDISIRSELTDSLE